MCLSTRGNYLSSAVPGDREGRVVFEILPQQKDQVNVRVEALSIIP